MRPFGEGQVFIGFIARYEKVASKTSSLEGSNLLLRQFGKRLTLCINRKLTERVSITDRAIRTL
jgi:hypothetical protein